MKLRRGFQPRRQRLGGIYSLCDHPFYIALILKHMEESVGMWADAVVVGLVAEQPERPRHARVFGDLHSLTEKIRAERRAALNGFREAVLNGSYPADTETAKIPDEELQQFLNEISLRKAAE